MKLKFLLCAVAVSSMVAGCKKNGTKQQDNTETPNPEMTTTSTPADTLKNEDTIVKMTTDKGDILIRLYADTPVHSENFVKLAKTGQYDGVLFHRVIEDFMIQGGDPESKNASKGQMLGSGDVGYTLPAEFVYPRHFHKRGALAAARQGDNVNPERRSSGCQFYIVTGEVFDKSMLEQISMMTGAEFTPEQMAAYTTEGGTPHLDGQYTVFGEVISGMDVVDAIQKVDTDRFDRPVDDVRIIKVTVEE